MRFKSEFVKSTFFVFAALVCVTWSAAASAQTTIPGGTMGSQTWTASGSPYIIEGDLTVKPGGTLTIESGVEVHFVSGDNMSAGRDTSRTELIVEGSIDVNGTAAQPVRFIPDSGTTAVGTNLKHWKGVEIAENATGATFDHLQLENAETGILVYADTTIENSEVRNTHLRAVHVLEGTATIDSTRIHENHGKAIYVRGSGELHLFDSIVHDNESDAVDIWADDVTTAAHVLDGNTIHRNGSSGISVLANRDTEASVDVVNCNVTDNGSAGVWFDEKLDDGKVRYSNAWSNSNGDFPPLDRHRGPGLLSSNPLYVDRDQGNFELTSRSPSRNNGDAGQDIGAVAFDGVPTQELTGYLWEDTTLTAAESPYVVEGDLTIPSGVTLTIEPGVTVGVSSTCIQRSGRLAVEIDVAGAVDINGTRMSPVKIIREYGVTPAGDERDHWTALRILETATRADIDWLQLENAEYGLMSFSPHTRIRGGHFRNNARQGIYVGGGRAEINGVLVHENGWAGGVRVERGGELYLANSVIRDNEGDGVGVQLAEQSTSRHEIRNNTIYRNTDTGIDISSLPHTDASVFVSNTIVTHNERWGISPARYAVTYVSYSNVWGNSDGDYGSTRSLDGGLNKGSRTLSAKPLYENAPDDLRLTSLSPGLDTGRSADAPDLDFDGNARPADGDGINGAEYDMGAFEFGATADCGDGAIGTGESCDDGARNGAYGACDATCSGPAGFCGDGTIQASHEQCDDGNTEDGDGCSSACEDEAGGGDAVADAGGGVGTDAGHGADADTAGDVGSDIDGPSGADAGSDVRTGADAGSGGEDAPGDDGGGCSSTGDGPASGLYLLVLAVGLGLRRLSRRSCGR